MDEDLPHKSGMWTFIFSYLSVIFVFLLCMRVNDNRSVQASGGDRSAPDVLSARRSHG